MASVWYIGSALARIIPSEDWEEIGFPGRPETRWNAANGYSVHQSEFTAGQLAVLDAQDQFLLTLSDGPRPGVTPQPEREVVSRGWVLERINEAALGGGVGELPAPAVIDGGGP
ncbi:hypothetical protein QEH44_gp48 [Arthrobacter phage Shambre1]|uniref:Uncharacterized protein n=1 Tax=Arthrobacter phage Shambre1 TaxID=2927284 RepID=A0A977PS05_9CAUD|nr:hypothetical protein QEH44_gp48 [Arthrobacter phage Shambre1]UXE04784.1 hypothetical protein SEA_SHAMBRE1_48 [Arthrobacter phage Shambre1]